MSSGDDALNTQDQSAMGSGEAAVADARRMAIDVAIETSGPCRRHVSVTIPRDEINAVYADSVEELASTAQVPGFRVGHVPKALIEKRFRKELQGQLKQKLLVDSLEQLSEEHSLDPIDQPDIDIEAIEIPEEGDFTYEFDVEVRPEFDLPDYQGLKIRRPEMEVADADVDNYLEQFLSQYGEMEPVDGPAEAGDFVVVSVTFTHDGREINRASNQSIRIRPTLRFRDAELQGFDTLMVGVKEGEVREADVVVSREAESIEMRGETVHIEFKVLGVKRQKLPELTPAFLERIGVDSADALRSEIREVLERQVVYEQRQAVRAQVLEKITESADWELPEEMVMKQVENAMRRQVLEMQQAGFPFSEIKARENELRQRALSTTTQALKEHFVLDKIASTEGIETTAEDIEIEILRMAFQQGESPRRLRSRLVKSGVIENLEAQLRERKAVDFILSKAEFESYKVERPAANQVEAVPLSVSGAVTAAAQPEAEDADDE